jgi:zinc/manganese transport system ATP-binding protein
VTVHSSPSPTADAADDVAVRARRVCAARDGHQVLVDIDVAFSTGRLAVLTGPNGAGKSTLVEVLAGVLPVTSGAVDRSVPVHSFVPQRAAVPDRLPVTVREVVTMGTWGRTGRTSPWRRADQESRRRVNDAISVLDLAALCRRPFATLSGGERQRALLAQGLARRADLLLLDEPTTGLDASSAALICGAIVREAARGAAVVCVSHDPIVVELADQVVRLDHGRVVDMDGRHPAEGANPRA